MGENRRELYLGSSFKLLFLEWIKKYRMNHVSSSIHAYPDRCGVDDPGSIIIITFRKKNLETATRYDNYL